MKKTLLMMRLKARNMKFINNALLLLAFLGASVAQAQDSLKASTPPQKFQKIKIDGVIATIGDYIVLESDIDKAYLEISSQGQSIADISRCQILGRLMEDKLYAHQAIQDSIIVTDAQVREKFDSQVGYMVDQLGSMDKVVAYFKKESEEDFRADLSEIIRTNALTEQMQERIIDGVEITPEEVRTFFNKIPKEDLPTFGAEMEVAQIVIEPKVSEEEKQKVINQLKQFKKEIQEGASFFSKAVLYTQDPGSKSTGGFYKMNRRTPFVKEFKDVAFSLDEGEISEPFETSFGYHIIMVEKIRGQERELRHILITPKVTTEALQAAREQAITIKKTIDEGTISFEDAARQMSDEKETRTNGGILINPRTQDTRFELTKMDPKLYSQIANLKDREVSNPVMDEDETGRKKYKLLTVINRYNEHIADYSQDYIKIKNLALKEKQIQTVAKWSDEKIKETYIKLNGQYSSCEFTNNWSKKN